MTSMTSMTSIEGQPLQKKAEIPIKTRVIWVPGMFLYIYIYIHIYINMICAWISKQPVLNGCVVKQLAKITSPQVKKTWGRATSHCSWPAMLQPFQWRAGIP